MPAGHEVLRMQEMLLTGSLVGVVTPLPFPLWSLTVKMPPLLHRADGLASVCETAWTPRRISKEMRRQCEVWLQPLHVHRQSDVDVWTCGWTTTG